jgi:arylsulfatase A-like enzyme
MLPKDFLITSSEKAITFLEENRENAFYLELNYMDTHRDEYGEFRPTEEFYADPERIAVPDYYALPDWPEIKSDIAKYYANTSVMDRKIGEVLDTLDELGIADRTIVCFVSDNGAQFPGGIMSLYDRGIGTPLILRWPGRIAPGTSSAQLASTIDLMPTLLEAAGCTIPEDVQGKSLLSTAMGRKGTILREAVFAEMTYHVDYLPMRAARTANWKYIRNYSDDPIGLDQLAHKEWAHRLCELPNHGWTGPRVPEELYNLDNDPTEQRNLVDNPAFKDELTRLRHLLDEHMQETGDPFHGREFEKNYVETNSRRSPDKPYY